MSHRDESDGVAGGGGGGGGLAGGGHLLPQITLQHLAVLLARRLLDLLELLEVEVELLASGNLT